MIEQPEQVDSGLSQSRQLFLFCMALERDSERRAREGAGVPGGRMAQGYWTSLTNRVRKSAAVIGGSDREQQKEDSPEAPGGRT